MQSLNPVHKPVVAMGYWGGGRMWRVQHNKMLELLGAFERPHSNMI